ncbi:peroxidase-like [Amphibalanus amphitrite]|uniref:peroxidase-like n=1 Tax=Amphibalanus amphitrite TaxID=1232801 RepID=UPI001C914DBB|nr:peroxidase-like [Amphibalanus amphitrite]
MRSLLVCTLVALAAHSCDSQQHKRNIGGFQPAPVALGKCTTFEGKLGVCKRIQDLQGNYADVAQALKSPCNTPCISRGVCCPLGSAQSAATPRKGPGLIVYVEPPPVTVRVEQREVEKAAKFGASAQTRRRQQDAQLVQDNIVVSPQEPAFSHRKLQQPTRTALKKMSGAEVALSASKMIAMDQHLSPLESVAGLVKVTLRNTSLEETCEKPLRCRDSKYRTIDGSCNNLQHGHWGRAETALQRIGMAAYADGLLEPRRATDNSELPSARVVSMIVIPAHHAENSRHSMLLMQYGQFLDHDITHTPMIETDNGVKISCCKYGVKVRDSEIHSECYPIEMPPNDPFYAPFGERCMEMVRSVYAPRPSCYMGPREQMNQITAYVDGSNVYGSTEHEMMELRGHRGGLLKSRPVHGHPYLPADSFTCKDVKQPEHTCFKAGDERVNEQVDLVLMHTLWMREHNRLAAALASVNPHWDDERLFQEARRIVAAELQHITYNEFLPIVIGGRHMEKTKLLAPLKSGFSNNYDPTISAGITNEFSTAAFRMGHTLIPDNIISMSRFGNKEKVTPLHRTQFTPFDLYRKDAFSGLLRGLLEMPSMKFDNAFSKELLGRLFQFEGLFGMDLVALNIQRGRDHGIPSYNQLREICGMKKAQTWSDLATEIDSETISRFALLYKSVDDVDLFIGGVSERPVEDALVGPVFRCIITDQFARQKAGDRYFYEEGGQTGSFTLDQLNEIRKVRLSRVICDNDDQMEWVQPLSMIKPDPNTNPRTSCLDTGVLPVLDITKWAE